MHRYQDFPKFSTPKLLQFKFKMTGPCDFAGIAALNCFCRYQVMNSLYSKQLGFEWDFKLGGLDDIWTFNITSIRIERNIPTPYSMFSSAMVKDPDLAVSVVVKNSNLNKVGDVHIYRLNHNLPMFNNRSCRHPLNYIVFEDDQALEVSTVYPDPLL
jgi:hypothetical protein